MSLNESPLQPPKKRRLIIKRNTPSKTIKEIAEMCGCESRTIDRDILVMKESGEWWQWIEYELHRLHKEGNVSDESKYREMSKLYAKQFITEKKADTHTGDITIKWMNSHESDTDDTVLPS